MMLLLLAVHGYLWLTLVGNLVYLRRQPRPAPAVTGPRVSILVPARNEEANLQRLLPSVLAQTYPSLEVIVYDDGSEDGTGAVLRAGADPRLRVLRGEGPPPGWVGKVHALYQATRQATGTVYLFLDADVELADPEALARLVARYQALPPTSVLTALTRLRGGGLLLVGLVPHAILTGLPWPLVRPSPFGSVAALNGQCWMIDAATYHRLEPHAHHPDEVLEDVQIGRYLKRHGVIPVLSNLMDEVAVYMYPRFGDAWHGFRKNAYLILGGTPLSFVLLFGLFVVTYTVAPLVAPAFLLSVYGLKLVTDRVARFPLWLSLLTPVSWLLGLLLQFDSALAHWMGRVAWKGRKV
jgi:glycosyltransferase involved in cell wall biosynthesis